MSIRIMNLVWHHAPYEGNTLLTLLAFADWADDDGVCWPKISTAATKTRQSERNVKNCVKRLIEDGVLVVLEESSGPGVPNKYQIMGAKIAPLRGEKYDTEGVKNTTGRGEKRDIAIRKNHQEPPGEPLSDVPSDGPSLFPDSEAPPSPAKKKKAGPVSKLRSFEDEVKSQTKDEWEREWLPRIWQYYCTRTERGPLYMATSKRVRVGLERLRDLVGVYGDKQDLNDDKVLEQVRKKALYGFRIAIDNLAEDEFLSGKNDRETEYRDWHDHLCKTWETFEKRLRSK